MPAEKFNTKQHKTQLNLLQQLLDQAKVEDPDIREYLRKTSGIREIPKESNDHKEELRRLRIQNKKLSQQLDSLKEELQAKRIGRSDMMYNVDFLLKLGNALSNALGSCSNCWGQNIECSICHGAGKPGWRPVNKKMFSNYVLPCLQKMSVNQMR
jgi:hypothetical protein